MATFKRKIWMRTFAFGLIILCEILLLLLWKFSLNASMLSMLSTLIVVVLVSFLLSAILSKIQSIKLSRNYGISGVVGIVSGIIYFLWAKDNFNRMVEWIDSYGQLILLFMILIAAAILFFYRGTNQKEVETHSTRPD